MLKILRILMFLRISEIKKRQQKITFLKNTIKNLINWWRMKNHVEKRSLKDLNYTVRK